jgi:hypothetical protein
VHNNAFSATSFAMRPGRSRVRRGRQSVPSAFSGVFLFRFYKQKNCFVVVSSSSSEVHFFFLVFHWMMERPILLRSGKL